jgi:hypothetical protein
MLGMHLVGNTQILTGGDIFIDYPGAIDRTIYDYHADKII